MGNSLPKWAVAVALVLPAAAILRGQPQPSPPATPTVPPDGAASETELPEGTDPLQDQLLEGLDQLLPSVAPDSTAPDSTAPKSQDVPLDQSGAGEDVGAAGDSDPVSVIRRKMLSAQERIERQQVENKTQLLQREILQHLDDLLTAQEQLCRSSASGRAAEDQQSSAEGSPTGSSAAEQSTPRVSAEDSTAGNPTQPEGLTRGVWGQLPERFWQQLRAAGVEQFLPKYETLIEQYYKSLAENESDFP